MSQQQWIKIINNFPSRCVQCGDWIAVGQTALWMKGLGIKHEECPIGLEKDESALVVIDQEDKERLGWK